MTHTNLNFSIITIAARFAHWSHGSRETALSNGSARTFRTPRTLISHRAGETSWSDGTWFSSTTRLNKISKRHKHSFETYISSFPRISLFSLFSLQSRFARWSGWSWRSITTITARLTGMTFDSLWTHFAGQTDWTLWTFGTHFSWSALNALRSLFALFSI